MWTPFCAGFRSQKQAISAWKSRSSPLWRMRMAFAERVTPARERLMASRGRGLLEVVRERCAGSCSSVISLSSVSTCGAERSMTDAGAFGPPVPARV